MLTVAELRRNIEGQPRNRIRNLAMLAALARSRGLAGHDPVPPELVVPPDASAGARRAAVEALVAERIAAHVAARGEHAGLIRVRRRWVVVEEPAAAGNWRGGLRDLIRLASGGRGKPPPTPLVALQREARRRLGLTTKAFGEVYGGAAHAWLFGQTRPQGPRASATLERIAADAGMDPKPFLAGLHPYWGGPAGDRRRPRGRDYGLLAHGYAPPWLEGEALARANDEPAAAPLRPRARARVHASPDGTLAVFHGPRRPARYAADGAPLDHDALLAA